MCRRCPEAVAFAWHIAYACRKGKGIRRTLKQTLKTITGAEAVLVLYVHCGLFFGRCESKDAQMANYISMFGKAAIWKCFTSSETNTRMSAEYQNYFQSEITRRVLMENTVHRARDTRHSSSNYGFTKISFVR
jgi:hypothetical protein